MPSSKNPASPAEPGELPPRQPSLATRLSLEELEALTPELRRKLATDYGLEVRVASNSDSLKALLKRAGASGDPVQAMYDKVYDRTTPGYDRVYDRG